MYLHFCASKPSLPATGFLAPQIYSQNPCYKCTAADKNNMMQQPQTILSALADHIVSAALSLDAAAAFSQPPVFTVKNRIPFHNSSLLPYSSFIAPPLLANTRITFSVKILGQWPPSGCLSLAFVAGTGNQRGLQQKQSSKQSDACSKNSSFRSSGNDLGAKHRSWCHHSPVSCTHFHGKVGHALRDFHGFRTICTGFAHYSLTPARSLALKSGWIA